MNSENKATIVPDCKCPRCGEKVKWYDEEAVVCIKCKWTTDYYEAYKAFKSNMKVKKARKNFVPVKRARSHQGETLKEALSRVDRELEAFQQGAQEATEASYVQDQTRETGQDSKPKNWETFVKETRELLEPTASGKGYNSTGVGGKNELFEFVFGIAGPGHALGEIVYKAVRYKNKKDEKDILKIAAWAYLIWRFGK